MNDGVPTILTPFRTLPVRAVSGIRANTETRIFLLQASVICYALTAAAFRSDRPSIFDDPAALVRLAIPASAALFGLLLRDAAANPTDRPPQAAAVDVMVAAGFAFASEVALSLLKPDLVLPRWAPTQGGFVGASLLVFCRALFPPRGQPPLIATQLSLSEINWKAENLGQRIGRRARAYLAVSIVIGVVAMYFILTGSVKTRVASGILVAGTAYMIYQVRVRSVAAIVPTATGPSERADSYRRDLQRQQSFLARASYWFYGALLPGFALALLGSPVYPYWTLPVILMAAALNHRVAEELACDVEELDASETSSAVNEHS